MIASRVSHIRLPIDFGPGSESALRYANADYVVRTAHCPVLEVRDSGAVRVLHRERAH